MNKWLWAILPTLILAALVAVFLTVGSPGLMRSDLPPIEKIAIEKIELTLNDIIIQVRGDGPDPVTIAQVIVNDAYRQFSIAPEGPVSRLGTAAITIPYPWQPGEPEHITLVSSTGVTFPAEIGVAALTPKPSAGLFASLGLAGVYIGIIPVFLGILWLPFIKRLSRGLYGFLLSLTLGLLLFLGIDSLVEAVELAHSVPESLKPTGAIILGFAFAFLSIYAVSMRTREIGASKRTGESLPPRIALSIAIGIGAHNLGEGLAVGGAYALGEAALGAALVVGFMIHNLTEGVAIVAPLSRARSSLRYLALLGIVAGAPAVAGAWIGGFAYSPFWAAVFLAAGGGAIFQVFIEILSHMAGGEVTKLITPGNAAGFIAGIAGMYLTSLLVSV